MVIIYLQLERIPFDHQIHLFVWRSNGYENQGKGYGKALIDFLASKYADEYSEFLYGQLWSPNLWVWCTVNRYGIFAKMFITSFLKIYIVRFFESIRCCYAFVYVLIEVINFINKSGRTHNKGVWGPELARTVWD